MLCSTVMRLVIRADMSQVKEAAVDMMVESITGTVAPIDITTDKAAADMIQAIRALADMTSAIRVLADMTQAERVLAFMNSSRMEVADATADLTTVRK